VLESHSRGVDHESRTGLIFQMMFLLPILPSVGWVCQECVDVISDKRKTIDMEFKMPTSAVYKLEEVIPS